MTQVASSTARDEVVGHTGDPDDVTAPLAEHLIRIDHVAIAVENLDAAERWYTEVLGFRCVERRVLEGKRSGMISAVMKLGPVVFVLIQGTNPESQVTRFIEHYGQGVQHVALEVRGIEQLVTALQKRHLEFSTSLVESPDLRQAFTRRNAQTGLMIEFIERGQFAGFTDENVRSLFSQLEASDSF